MFGKFLKHRIENVMTVVNIRVDDILIEADTLLSVQKIEDGSLIAYYQGEKFDIDPSEYIVITTMPKSTTH